MIIIAGHLTVDQNERDDYLLGCVEVTRAARSTAGCIDFHLSADPVELDRINVFERWESVEAVEAFRAGGPSADQQAAIIDAVVAQFEIAAVTPLT
jgi:quinol monooxygenase YgiN